MSGRTSSRRRSKTQRLIDSEQQDTPAATGPKSTSSKKSSSVGVQKPKYNVAEVQQDRSETPSSSRSRLSTPASSRATSRSPTPTPPSKTNSRRQSVTKSSAKETPSRASSRVKKTVKAINGRSGSATPLSRASRSSSVNSRKASKVSPSKLKTKIKIGRGYNPSIVPYKESEYHYGSDFEESDDDQIQYDDDPDKESDSSDEESAESEDSDNLVESEVEWDDDGEKVKSGVDSRPSTPVPFWLKTEDEEIIPELKLPKSSDDLMIDPELAFKASGVYEILRHYYLILRLSLFRFEDFCAALASEEQSNLMSEIHIALLKAMVRAEEKDNTQFGPMDHKDSINALFYFVDTITWPEALRQYLRSDNGYYAEPLSIFEKFPEYPVCSRIKQETEEAEEKGRSSKDFIAARIEMLGFLADQFLTTSGVREDITNEGALAGEDHCRVCFRVGDMVVCEMCNGVYHLACLNPPLLDVPEYDWQCYVCQAHQIDGVIDCVDDAEKNGTKVRHDALGFDRAGNKYWFIVRRIFIEEYNTGQIRYFTSVPQFEELMEALDNRYFEADLCQTIEFEKAEIERQMELTEKLTNDLKPSLSKKSYLELENQTIVKAQEERQEEQLQEERERREAEEAIDQQLKEAEEAKKKAEEEEKAKKEEEKRREREDRLRKREESRGDSFPDLGENEIKKEDDLEIKEEEVPMETSEEVITTDGEIKEENTEPNKQTIVVKPPPGIEPRYHTRRTLKELSEGTLLFKLGQEGTFRTYINQFTTNPNALSKVQANDERVKRTHMSHKFSLTEASTFRWMGQLYGKRDHLVNTLRQSMLQLESNVPLIFMHANWHLMRKAWIQALNTSGTPREFARALTVLQCCLKPVVMLNVWYDSLGHTQLKKITQQMKDDKKKMEKRERKELEEENERLRPWMTFVKYTLGLKHQVSKQKGEEYRAHGQYGWLWLSSTRRFTPQDATTVGLRAGPHRLAVKYTDTRNDSFKIVLMEPKAFKYLLQKQEDMEKAELASSLLGESKDEGSSSTESSSTAEGEAKDAKIGIEKKKLEQALKHARLERQVPTKDMFAEVVDISAALSNQTRILYPKVAKKGQVLDDFLQRRLQLKTLEERRIELKLGKANNQANTEKNVSSDSNKTENNVKKLEGESDTKTSITSDLAEKSASNKEPDSKKFVELTKRALWDVWIKKLKSEASKLPDRSKHGLKCYVVTCKGEPGSECYSVTCPYRKISSPLVKEISEKVLPSMMSEAKKYGLDVTSIQLSPDESVTESINILQNFVKILMKTKDEADNLNVIGMSTVTTSTVSTTTTKSVTQVNGEVTATSSLTSTTTSISNEKSDNSGNSVKTETSQTSVNAKSVTSTSEGGKVEANIEATKKEAVINAKLGDMTRIYSSSDASGKLYLKRIQTVAESKKQSKIIRYPLAPSFYCPSRRKRNILNLAKHDAKRLARRCGTVTCEGFNYSSKSNNLVWPYPCPRPAFRTAWLYKTSSLNSIQAVAMQMRILWACIQWDDLQTKPTSIDGKHQETTETAIITTEIIKHRHTGRFQEFTEYFQRKVTIPLDMPKKQSSDNTPIRSGLRKRKREEAPVQTEPEVKEEWIPEEKLELWEIRAYRDRLERDRNAAITRTRTGTQIKEPQRFETLKFQPPPNKQTNQTDVKSKMDEQQQAVGRSVLSHSQTTNSLTQQQPMTPPTIIRRIQNPDGSVSILRTTMNTNQQIVRQSPQQQQVIQPGTKKVFISKDGKIIGAQLVQQPSPVGGANQNTTKISLPSVAGGVQNPVATPTTVVQQPTPVTPSPQQKVQIVRSADGKIQVRGLLPGQQLVQMPDGKLQIFSQPNAPQQQQQQQQQQQPQTQPQPQPQQQTTPTVISTPTTTNVQGVQGNRIVVHPSGTTTNIGSPAPAQIVPNSPVKSTPTKSIVATPLNPGQAIPPGTTVFMSGGKTYCIPKATMTAATQQQQPQPTTVMQAQPVAQTISTPATPTLPVNPVPQQQLTSPQQQQSQPQQQQQQQQQPTSTIGTVQTQNNAGQKQMVEVKSLGQNTVTLKGNQMIVSGPDIAQAQLIAKQLSSGAARLATLNGKQVLISTTPTVINQQQQATQQTAVTQQVQPQTTQIITQQQQQPAVVQQQQQQPAVVQQQQQQQTAVKTEIPNNVKLPSEPLPPTAIKKDEQVKPQPTLTVPAAATPASAAPAATHVTAQLVQTGAGPRIVLQGIQGANLTKEQLHSIQQQVKDQLLKAQAEAKQQGKVPPTKIAIQLPQSISNVALTTPANPVKVTAPTAASGASPNMIVSSSANTVASVVPSMATTQLNSSPIRQQQIITTASGQKVILMTNPGQKQVINVPQNTNVTPVTMPIKSSVGDTTTTTATAPKTQSLLMTSLTSPQKAAKPAPAATTPGSGGGSGTPESGGKFEVTQEYIQQTIQNALKKDNLSPELEHKLQASLQQYSENTNSGHRSRNEKSKVEIDPATGEPMDEEWDGASYAERSIANKNKRKRVEQSVISERIANNTGVRGGAPLTPSQAAAARSSSVNKTVLTPKNTTNTSNNAVVPSDDNKQKVIVQQKLQSMLLTQKEQLKREIKQKRNSHEREIQSQIKDQMNSIQNSNQGSGNNTKTVTLTAGQALPQQIVAAAAVGSTPTTISKPVEDLMFSTSTTEKENNSKQQTTADDINIKTTTTSIPEPIEDGPPANLLQNSYEAISSGDLHNNSNIVEMNNKRTANKRQRNASSESSEGSNDNTLEIIQEPPKKKKKRRSSGQASSTSVKKDKVYCICRTKYDPKKFYVGCDVCNNWFHGSCVGINENMAKTMTEYICDECRNARENREIYCICQQPYDETQFYIGCEKCSDWFHGRCVGVLQSEADKIDEYLCPRCAPGSALNMPNQKILNAEDYENIKRLVKQLWANRNSIPFQNPVDPEAVPAYYKLIKEPMDLGNIDKKVNNGSYNKLCEFVGDVMRIFENCRFFNQPSSSIMKSAEGLEAFFNSKLDQLRQKVANSSG